MSETQVQARRQQRVEELCAASIRALSGDADLHFRGRRLHRGRKALPLFAPHLHPNIDKDDFSSFRGAADGLALRLAMSDAALHRSLVPQEPVQRLVFDLLEQIRVESLADAAMPGVARNLAHNFEQWSLAFHHAGLTDSARGILLYTLVQVCRARVLARPVVEATEDLLETTRGALAPMIGHELAALRRERADQAAYAPHALAIAKLIADMIASTDDEEGANLNADEVDAEDIERAAFRLVMQVGKNMPDTLASVVTGRSLVLEGADGVYRVFSKAYDRVVNAVDLARKAELQELRVQLDRCIAEQHFNLPRLARELKALLARPRRDGWDRAQEEGLIDGRRLAQLVSSPLERRLFQVERYEPLADCVVTLLIDCSGSMREHSESVAMLADTLLRALEMAGIHSEALGFTTGAWHGGRVQRDWAKAGRPAFPGRLNELRHIVFKDAETSWRKARTGVAALLKPDLLRESVDGEALEWACSRLALREEGRKLLIVLSDGCPMDGATNLANDAFYLDNHLKQVVQRIEERGEIEVCALGVGLDLSPYYSHCRALDLTSPPGNAVFREVLELIAGRARR